MPPTPNIPLDRNPECRTYLAEGSHRRLNAFSPGEYRVNRGIWESEMALPDDAPEGFHEIAQRLTKKAQQGAGSL